MSGITDIDLLNARLEGIQVEREEMRLTALSKFGSVGCFRWIMEHQTEIKALDDEENEIKELLRRKDV